MSNIKITRGKIDPTSFYQDAVRQVTSSRLNGFVPRDGAKYGITKGTPQEWARLFTKLAQQESGLRQATVNPDGTLKKFKTTPENDSFGPLQFNKGQYGLRTWQDVNDPSKSIGAAIKVAERFVLTTGTIASRGKGKDYPAGWGGMAAYFGPFRTGIILSKDANAWFNQNVNTDASVMPPGQQTDQPSGQPSEQPSSTQQPADQKSSEVERIPESRRKAIETLRNSEQYKHHSTEKINEIVEDVVKNVPGANIDNVLDKLSSGVERLNFSSMSDLLPGTAPIEIAVQQTQSELTQQTSPVTPDQQPSDFNQQAGQPKKISSGFHKSTNMLNKVDPMLKEGLLQGAVRAFGDPNDPKTRYELRINNAVRPGDSGKHGKGKAADVQIYDRQTKQFVGGSDIFKSGLGANAYGIQQALVRGGYQYLYEKYGKKAADRFTWGGNFIAKQFKKRGFAGLDTMHVSLDEHGRHGSVAGGPTKEVAEWLKSQGVQFESDRMDLAKWRSVYNTTYETSLTQSGEEVQQMISATRTTTAPAIFDAAIATTPAAAPAAAPTAEPAAGTNKKTASLNSYDVRDVRAMTQAADTQAQNDAQNKAISSVLNTHAMDAAQDGPATTPTPAAPTLPTPAAPAAPAAPADPFRGAFSSPNINNSNAVTTANVPQVSSTPAVDPQDGPGTPSPPTVSPSMPSIVAAATPVAPPPPKTQNFSLDGAFVPSNPSVVTTNPDDIAARAASTRMTERTTEGGGSASSGAGGGGQGPSSAPSQSSADHQPASPGSTGQSMSDESLCWV